MLTMAHLTVSPYPKYTLPAPPESVSASMTASYRRPSGPNGTRQCFPTVQGARRVGTWGIKRFVVDISEIAGGEAPQETGDAAAGEADAGPPVADMYGE